MKAYLLVILLSAVTVLGGSTAPSERSPSRPVPPLVKVIVLWNENASGADSVDQESYVGTVLSMGFSPSKEEVDGRWAGRMAVRNVKPKWLGCGGPIRGIST